MKQFDLNGLLNNQKVQLFKVLVKSVSEISFIVTICGLFIYFVSYSFLYGFFFGGNLGEDYPIMHLFIYPIPFSSKTLLIISILIVSSCTFLITSALDLKNNGLKRIYLFLVVFLLFHLLITIFFVGGSDIGTKLLEFLTIWIVPLVLSVFIVFMIRISMKLFLSFTGVLFGSILYLVFYTTIGFEKPLTNFNFIVFLMMIYSSSIVFSFFKMERFIKIIVIFPYYFWIVLLGNLAISKFYSNYSLNVFSILLNIFLLFGGLLFTYFYWEKVKNISFLSKKNKKEEVLPTIQDRKGFFSILFRKENKWFKFSLLSIIVLFFLSTCPFVSFSIGQYVRFVIPQTSLVKEKMIFSTNNPEIKGIIVTESNNTYFISDENWRLIILKTDFINTKVDK